MDVSQGARSPPIEQLLLSSVRTFFILVVYCQLVTIH